MYYKKLILWESNSISQVVNKMNNPFLTSIIQQLRVLLPQLTHEQKRGLPFLCQLAGVPEQTKPMPPPPPRIPVQREEISTTDYELVIQLSHQDVGLVTSVVSYLPDLPREVRRGLFWWLGHLCENHKYDEILMNTIFACSSDAGKKWLQRKMNVGSRRNQLEEMKKEFGEHSLSSALKSAKEVLDKKMIPNTISCTYRQKQKARMPAVSVGNLSTVAFRSGKVQKHTVQKREEQQAADALLNLMK